MQNFIDTETGELFYSPIKLNPKQLINRVYSWVRIFVYGFCPKCNSDAPELYICEVCNWDSSSPFDKIKKKKYWNRWKLLDNNT